MKRFSKAVILTGLFVGTTDLVSAFVNQYISTGKYADGMLKYIAGVAIGMKNAFPGNDWIALLGLIIHYFIAMSFTLFFFLIFPRLKFLHYNKYLTGMLYGVFVSLVFNQVILPLFQPRWAFSLTRSYIDWVVFGIIFGIPIVYNAYKYYNVD
ncbi:MAG TPA: hypothetical protein VGM31_00575 [Puia sp.]